MKKHLVGGLIGLALAVSAAAPALASGGSGGGGGGGGGGGTTTTTATCGKLSVAVTLTSNGARVLSGKTDKSCDTLPVEIAFTDTTPVADCTLYMPTYGNPLYFKYGFRPPSRYENNGLFVMSSGCSGTSHSIHAVMTDKSSGAVYGTADTTWVAP